MRRAMRAIAGRMSNCSLRIRILTIILTNSIVILICTFLGYFLYTGTYNRLLYQAMASNLTEASYQISAELESVEELSAMILSSENIQNALSELKETDDGIEMSECNRVLNNALMDYSAYADSKIVVCMTLYNDKFTNTTNWAQLAKIPDDLLEEAKADGLEKDGAVSWTYSGRGSCMLLGREIRKIDNLSLEYIGELIISVDLDQLVKESTRSISMFQDQSFLIADQEGCILYASQELTDDDAAFFLSHADSGWQLLTWQDHDYFQVCGSLPGYGYRYISLASLDEITDTLKGTLGMVVLVILLGILLVLILTNRLVRSVARQFDALNRKMEDFTSHELTLPQEEENYSGENSEIGALHRHFDQMANRIQNLVQVNYVNDILRKDAQLEALKAQINPHFLYNTLETVNWRAKACGDEQTSQIVEALGTVLRGSLSVKKPLVTLAYEKELADAYMTIQKIRFEDRLDYSGTAQEGITDALIPPLTIQPLMENAIHYGMEEMLEVCHIRLRMFLRDGLLIVQVENDGSQFEDHLIEKLKNKTVDSHGFGIGLLNIEQRLKLLFGEEYGLSLFNEDGFAVAAIRIPYRREEG